MFYISSHKDDTTFIHNTGARVLFQGKRINQNAHLIHTSLVQQKTGSHQPPTAGLKHRTQYPMVHINRFDQ
ncbi:hypothetical protein F511_43022 [Dorcoceras hygrometricum]|uniref:Uncharacterized protein n=1 Tax=Dorcoceras hygrometricum TaxID=472368 RepID=A0A2Z7A6F0_9LAMI|nr:hypothetical protein F511_43022 [Dorcoceras hygrometricum]